VSAAAIEAVRAFGQEIADRSARLGRRVAVDQAVLTERAAFLDLAEPGEWSANRSCRMVRALDGWIAVNLPRGSDLELVPAWIGCGLDDEPWPAILEAARVRPVEGLVEDAQRLGLAVTRVGSVAAGPARAPLRRMAAGVVRRNRRPRVLDLSSLWAGPLCGALLAEAGAEVVKMESLGRPDGARATPGFFARLNGSKASLVLDFARPQDLARLATEIEGADVVITSARPRAFAALGLEPSVVFAANPGLTWVAITGYGWTGAACNHVAFGDDAAAAGGLVRWTANGPEFVGDALADPLTGLAAAAGGLRALELGGGLLVDAALATTAAGVAAGARMEAAA
jgi:hypothetical protein